MSTSSITGMSVRDLAATITRQVDADKDGTISTTEFEGFLTQFLGAMQERAAGSGAAAGVPWPGLTPAAERPVVGTMAGFDAGKLADTAHKTPKYEIGRILQRYPNTPQGLRDALPEIQRLAPNAAIVGSKRDKIDFGDYTDEKGRKVGVVDILQAAGLGGTAWQWIPVA